MAGKERRRDAKALRDENAALRDECERRSDEALADRLRADRRLAERNAAIEAKDAAEAARTTATKERDELQAEVERLRAALLEAAETVQEWGSQAPDYAQEKVGLAEEIERIRATATRGG